LIKDLSWSFVGFDDTSLTSYNLNNRDENSGLFSKIVNENNTGVSQWCILDPLLLLISSMLARNYIPITDKTTLIHDFSDEFKAKSVTSRDLESFQKWSASWTHGDCIAVQPTENNTSSFLNKN
jgi:hypothetical protein